MKWLRWVSVVVLALFGLFALLSAAPEVKPTYVKKATRTETILASLKESGLPNLDGKWHVIGPFDNEDNKGFDTAYPPEKEIDLKKTYPGKDRKMVGWKEMPGFKLGQVVNLNIFGKSDDSTAYLFHEIDSPEAVTLPLSLGSDDQLTVWLNGKRLLAENVIRAASPDQNRVDLELKAGKNQLLLKVGNAAGDWSVYVCPELPPAWPAVVRNQFKRDYPAGGGGAPPKDTSAENAHYRIVTLPVPADCVLGRWRRRDSTRWQTARLHSSR